MVDAGDKELSVTHEFERGVSKKNTSRVRFTQRGEVDGLEGTPRRLPGVVRPCRSDEEKLFITTSKSGASDAV